MVVPILQALVGLIVALSGIAMAGKATASKKDQWAFRFIFSTLGILLIALAWLQFLNVSHLRVMALNSVPVSSQTTAVNVTNERQENIKPPSSPAESTPETTPAPAMPSSPASPDLTAKYALLLHHLAEDPSIPADARERIILATAELGQEARVSAQKPVDGAQLIAAESAKARILPLFDYAIKSLAVMSGAVAAQKGDKSVLDYHGLPENLNPDANDAKHQRKSAAEIRLQSNPGWDFQVYFAESVAPSYQASLSVTCKGGIVVLKSAKDSVETHIELLSGDSSEHKPSTGDAAKANIDDALKKLVTSETDAIDASR